MPQKSPSPADERKLTRMATLIAYYFSYLNSLLGQISTIINQIPNIQIAVIATLLARVRIC